MSTQVETRTSAAPRPSTTTGPARRPGVTLARVVAAEWTKLRSLRSTWWVLLITAVLSLGLAAAFAAAIGDSSAAPPRGGPAGGGLADPVKAVLGGFGFAALVLGVLGALSSAGEYATGTISASFMAVPRRWQVLAAKAVVLVSLVVPLAVALCYGSLWLGQLVLGDAATIDYTASETLRAVGGTVGYLAAVSLLGLGLGFLLRSSAGAITVLAAVVFVLPVLLPLISWDWVVAISDHLPGTAGSALQAKTGGTLSTLAASWTLAAWALIPLAASAVVVRRRDA